MSKGGSRSKVNEPTPEEEHDIEEEPVQLIEMKTDVIENDFLDKANMLPPKDPDSEQTIVPDLVILK
jgi:hypothetical protein